MNTQDLKQCIDRIEGCADEAKRAVQGNGIPQNVRDAVMAAHQKASQAKKDGTGNDDALRQCIADLEQAADRAMQACKQAGGQVDPQTQQAIQRLHDEASQAKHRAQAGSPA